ncbi:MAG: hypothetical protein U0Y10_06910 [Spirosomataceae bacterium]
MNSQENDEQLDLLKVIAQRHRLREQIQKIQASKLNEWKAEEEDNAVVFTLQKNNRWRTFSWSAAASVVATIGYLSIAELSYIPMTASSDRSNTIINQDITLQNLDEGIQLLKNDKPTEAIVLFNKIEATEGIRPYYGDAATWYEVVALLKANRKSEAKVLLMAIEANPNFQFEIPTLDKWKVKWRLLF